MNHFIPPSLPRPRTHPPPPPPPDVVGKHFRTLLQNLLHDRNLARVLALGRSRREAKSDHQLPLREGIPLSPLSGGARVAALPQRRGAVHRVQAVRGGVPRAGHHDRRRGEGGRRQEDHTLRHRYDQMHLLWICKLNRLCLSFLSFYIFIFGNQSCTQFATPSIDRCR